MSGIDEQHGPLISNNVFHQIFRSIRFDFTEGVEERMGWLLEVLPRTSIEDAKGMSDYLDRALLAWKQIDLDEDFSYGTRCFRDGPYCYMSPVAWIADWERVALLDTDGKVFYLQNYEGATRMYDLWKSRRLKAKEGE